MIDKQIEEMANSLYEAVTHLISLPTCRVIAKDVIKLGYRKQSEGELDSEVRVKAIKEFAERLKEDPFDIVFYGKIVTVSQIDRLMKEMTEGGEQE